MPKAFLTQRLANAYPLESDVRSDEQSLGFQVLNYAAGTRLDELYAEIERAKANLALTTSVVSDPDLFYVVRLPQSFEFDKPNEDNTELSYSAPSVSGSIDGTVYGISLAENNDIRGFWLEAVPSRITLAETQTGPHVLASGLAIDSPLYCVDALGEPFKANNLYVTCSGGEIYLDIDDEGNFKQTLVQVDGVTRAGVSLTEEMYGFLYDDSIPTSHEYSTFSGVRIYNADPPSGTFVWVKSARFNDGPYPVAYDIGSVADGQQVPYFWDVGQSETSHVGQLSLIKYDMNDWEVRAAGFVGRSSVMDIELVDGSMATIQPTDMAVEPFSNRLWVATSGMLHCYDASLPYPDFSQLVDKDYAAPCRIEPSSYTVVRGESVTLDYIWRNPSRGVVKHRVWLEDPNGNKYSIIDGIISTYTTGEDSWNIGQPIGSRKLRAADTFTLSLRGDYIFSMETVFDDETTSIDQRIVSVTYAQPLASYNLPDIGIGRPIWGVDIDSDYNLWVVDDRGYKYRLAKHYDIMLIDYVKKLLYLRESYDSVRVVE